MPESKCRERPQYLVLVQKDAYTDMEKQRALFMGIACGGKAWHVVSNADHPVHREVPLPPPLRTLNGFLTGVFSVFLTGFLSGILTGLTGVPDGYSVPEAEEGVDERRAGLHVWPQPKVKNVA